MRPFGDFRPDQSDLNTDTLDVCRNVLPAPNSWVPAKDLLPLSIAALPGVPRGLWYVQKTDGSYDTYAANRTSLFKYNADTLTFTDVSRISGGVYNLPADDYWSGIQFGSRLIVCQLGDFPQYIDVDSGANFQNLPNAPVARFISVMDDKVILASLSDNIARVQWSDINDSENWTPGDGSLAGNQEFPDHGACMGFFPHSRLLLLQQGMRAIISTGDIYSFNFPELTSQKGTAAPWSACEFGSVLYWLSEDGFYVGNSETQKNISEKRTSDYFYRNVNRERMFQVYSTFDPFSSRFYWTFPVGDGDLNERIMVYDWTLDRWGELEVPTFILARIATASISMEGGDEPQNMDLPGLPSLDNRVYMAGVPLLIAMGADSKLSTFDGPTLSATIETGSYTFGNTKRVRLRNVMPYFEGDGAEAVTCRVMKRQRFGDAWEISGDIPQQTSGFCRMNADGMFHRFQFHVPAGTEWTHAHGWEPSFVPTTER